METKAQSQMAGSTRWWDLVVGQLDLEVHISFTGIRHFVNQIYFVWFWSLFWTFAWYLCICVRYIFAFGNATKVWVTIFLSNCMQLSGTIRNCTLKYFERSLLCVKWGPARSKGNLKAMTLLLMMVTDVKFPKVTFTSLEKCGSAMIKYGLITQRTTNTSTRARWQRLVLRHSSCIKVWTWYPSHLLTLVGSSRDRSLP